MIVILLLLSVIMGGGFYTFTYGVAGVAEAVLLSFIVIKEKKIRLPKSLFGLGMAACCIFALFIPEWATDKVMAWDGTLRILAVGLFYILVLQKADRTLELLKDILHIFAATTVLASLAASGIPFLRDYVYVSGRLGGPFMYPNTYAIFLLVAMIWGVSTIYRRIMGACNRIRIIIDTVSLIICGAGIVLSGSKGVFLVSIAVVLALLIVSVFKSKAVRVRQLCIAALVVISGALAVLAVTVFTSGALDGRLSTMWGRLLYDMDAIRIIASHPAGLGYYGYYFIQGSMQSGVYSVVNVHNEYLQILLDLGFVPGALLLSGLIAHIISYSRYKSENGREISDSLVMAAIALHCVIDYDLQFLPIVMILLILIANREGQLGIIACIDIKWAGKIAAPVMAVLLSVFCLRIGLCDMMYVFGYSRIALRINPEHTMALTDIMMSSSDEKVLGEAADNVLNHNRYDTISYIIKAREAFSQGDIQTFIGYEEQAISTKPYDTTIYEEYLTLLRYALDMYMGSGDRESGIYVLEKMQQAADQLSGLSEHTSPLAFKIKDKPQFELDDEYKGLLEEAYRIVYNDQNP